jgi:cell division transport system ATP-binding protein
MSQNELADFRNAKIGFVFQFHHLLPEFTALENVMIPALIGKKSEKQIKTRAMELLTELGLKERVSHKPSELSGGEQQRVAIARALLNHPDLILADEPTGNLDPETSNEIMTLLKQVAMDNHAAVVMATHDYHMIQNFPGEAIRCEDGKVSVLNTAELFE